jgi:hypothetical protein
MFSWRNSDKIIKINRYASCLLSQDTNQLLFDNSRTFYVMYDSLPAVNSFSYVHACFSCLSSLIFFVSKTTCHRPFPEKSQTRNRLQFFNAS